MTVIRHDQHPLRRWRYQHRVTALQLADLIGVSLPAVSAYEIGRRHPRPAIMARIEAVTCGAVTASDFLPSFKISRQPASSQAGSAASAVPPGADFAGGGLGAAASGAFRSEAAE